jgi:methionyl-tRNA formyltransferase
MARIIVIGGIESTFTNAQVLHDLGEEIAMFYTRGIDSPGWEGVEMVEASQYPFSSKVPVTEVNGNINDYIGEMVDLKPDFIYSLGWQQIFYKGMLDLCSIIGIHESLLPEGAGAAPIANAILYDRPLTGISLFWLDNGMDTGQLIAQLRGKLDPRVANSTDIYKEHMALESDILRMMVPHINAGTAPAIPQDMSKRTKYDKISWEAWPEDKVKRAQVYPYV